MNKNVSPTNKLVKPPFWDIPTVIVLVIHVAVTIAVIIYLLVAS